MNEAHNIGSPPSYRALVGDALDLLYRVLRPYVEREMRAAYGDDWLKEAKRDLHNRPLSRWDTSDLLTLVFCKPVFRKIGHDGRSRVSLLREVRKRWAHQGELTLDETRRTLEHTILLLRAVGAEAEAARLEPQVLALMQLELRQRGPLGGGAAEADVAEENLLLRGWQKLRTALNKPSTEPLELRRDLLDAVERTAAPYQHHFDFNRLTLHLLAEDDATRALFETAVERQREPFRSAVRRRLADARIPLPARFSINWKFHRSIPTRFEDRFGDQPFYVELYRRRSALTASLTVLRGQTQQERYTLRGNQVVTVGRTAEVLDERGRLVRRNAVAFHDYEDPTLEADERDVHRTVSRAHAHLRYDQADAVFRLYDDRSTCGTSVVREGYPAPVQVKGQSVALQDGDLLYFGKACVRFNTGRGR